MRTLVGAAFAIGVLLAATASCGVDDPTDVAATNAYATSYPFGSRVDAYPYGIVVNHLSTSTMDSTIRSHYDAWKAARLVDVPSLPGGKAVKFNDPNYLAVSEGMGYGMLLTVLMAGHDPNAQSAFDGLLKTVRARPAYSIPAASGGPYLMDWRLASDGSSTDAAGGGWNALDADLDIAMGLLMADRQWGSTGTWNYKQEAIRTINAMKSWNFHSDGTPMANQRTSRTSDYMIGHFRAFAAATGDTFWNTVIDRTFALIDRMQKVYSPNAGLMPDFIVGVDTTSPYPSPGGQIESATEGDYFANGQRNPWRWGTDYVFSGDARWKGVLSKMMTFFIADTGGTPGPAVSQWGAPGFFGNFAVGYHLDGSHISGNWPAIGIVAGALNGAQIDAGYQSFMNQCWDWLEAKWTTNYYDSELTLLSEIVASGNWWNPTSSGTTQPQPPQSTTTGTKIQAEQGTLSGSGVSVMTDISGYEGSGFVGSFTTNGDQLSVSFGNVTAGTYDVRIRYHAWNQQQNTVVINGTSSTQTFPATSSAWANQTITGVQLAAATNTITIKKDWGWFEVDYIEIISTSTTTTPPPPSTGTTIHVQAEAGALSGSGIAVHDDLAGYEGSGFVGSFTTTGDRLTVSLPNAAAGTYNVRIHYHAWGAQQNNVSINGATAKSQAFAGTGSAWGDSTLSNVTLVAGTNTVAISKDWGYIDVDWVEAVPLTTAPATPATIHLQAEAGTLSGSGVGVHSDVAGYEGSGFVGSFTTSGDRLTLTYSNVVGATYTVRVRYHAWTDQQNDVSINNGTWTTQSFPATGSAWSVKTMTGVVLPTGTSTVAIRKNWGYIDVDWIEIAPQ